MWGVPGTLLAAMAMKKPNYKWYPVVGLVISGIGIVLIALFGQALSFGWLIVALHRATAGSIRFEGEGKALVVVVTMLRFIRRREI